MSFGWTGFFRAGSWYEFRRFILDQRRDVIARVTTINAELARIGEIQILYETDATDATRVSERRIGLNVTPNTSIEHLLRAYIAMGGNPFDISMFLSPNSVQMAEDTAPGPANSASPSTGSTPGGSGPVDNSNNNITQPADASAEATPDDQFIDTQPYGGMASSQSTDPLAGGLYTGGWLPMWRYPPRRFGNTVSYTAQAADTARTVHALRGWVTQEIKTLRNDIEARIIKLMDLREQLMNERDELLPTVVGGAIPGINWSANGEFASSHHVSTIVDDIDSVFYPNTLPNGSRDFDNPRTTGPNPDHPMYLDDATNGEEDWCSLG